ncbi:hypothetical protein ACJMK2_021992 [Sinanodonta woodiana]|uniref:Uncharacterized protein n=1 Tax=Sinanodonta woodiana TaxID=1069815 RepID=A0ABD3THU9_SINWO
MLLVMVAFFLQIERGSVSSKRTTGNETLFTRGPGKLSWTAAQESCGNMSSVLLPGLRDTGALELLHIGEFAWIDGKEYTFCFPKTDANETKEKCKYVTTKKEDTRENRTFICDSEDGYKAHDYRVPYADAINTCMKDKHSLFVVKDFVVPIVLPLNTTSWIGVYSDSSINSSLNPGQTVIPVCIGIMKLDHDTFEFGTTSCDENHTFICDASGLDTALTLTIRDEMMTQLGVMKARESSNAPRGSNLLLILTGPICGVLLVVIVIVIVIYWKRKLNTNLPYLSKYRPKSCVGQRIYTEQNSCEPSVPFTPQNPVPEIQDREMPRGDHAMELVKELKKKPLPFNSIKIKNNSQNQSYNRGNKTADLAYYKNELSLASSQNPEDDNNSFDSQHLPEGSETYLFSAQEDYTTPNYQAEAGQEGGRINVMYTDDEDEYANYRTSEMPLEYDVTKLDSN